MRRPRAWTVYIQRNGKNWRCRWIGIYGTGQKVFANKSDAEEFRLERRREFERRDAGLSPTLKSYSTITVAEWWLLYSKTKQREHPETFLRFDKPALTSFVGIYGRVAMAAITQENIQDYKYALEDKYRGDTPRMYYIRVCTFFNSAVKSGKIAESPAKAVKHPASSGQGGRPLHDFEIIPLFSIAPEALYRTGIFSMNTRLRINEVCILDWQWVWEIEVPSIGAVWMGRIPAELRKGRSKVFEDCIFPINSAARVVMGERKIKGRVFPWAAITIQHQMTRTRRAAKLEEDVTFHCFRHTGASRYLQSSGPDGGHMEDLLKTHQWDDPRSLLRYVKPDPATLWRRANSISIPIPASSQRLNAESRPQGDPTDGSH